MNTSARRQRFRAILEGKACAAPASVFDPLSARIAEDLGYETGIFAGSVASQVVIGAPDMTGLTLTEFAQQIYRICRAGELPLLVDADDGYGNALNVMRTVEELEAAGTAALTLEDTVLPFPYGAPTADHLISLEEGVGKMRAALAARRDPNLIIVGRTGALGITGLDDAIARLKAYAEAGVDAVFPLGVRNTDDLAAIHAAVGLPMVYAIGRQDSSDLGMLANSGVRVALKGHAPFAAAMKAVHDTLKALREGTPVVELPGLPEGDFLKRLTRKSDYERRIKDYLT